MDEPRAYFYYERDEARRPITTVCVLLSPNGRFLARGRALCSLQDNPCKATGRMYAEGRARKAYRKALNFRRAVRYDAKRDKHFCVGEFMQIDGPLTIGKLHPVEAKLIQSHFGTK